jgi:hypothetical protein
VVWNASRDTGYQLPGESEQVEDVAFLDSAPHPEEMRHPGPQVERRVTVRVTRILDFKRAPPGDVDV